MLFSVLFFFCDLVRLDRRFRCNRISSKKKNSRNEKKNCWHFVCALFQFQLCPTTSKREAIHYSVAGLRFISNWKPMLVNLKSECWKSDTQYLCQNVGIIFKLRLENSHYSVTWPKGSEHFYPCCRYHVFISLLNNAHAGCMCMREIRIIGNFWISVSVCVAFRLVV